MVIVLGMEASMPLIMMLSVGLLMLGSCWKLAIDA
jgi:hypothetical protein